MQLPSICWVGWMSVLFVTSIGHRGHCENEQQQQHRLEVKFAWKQLDYAFPSDEVRAKAIAGGHYVPENNLPNGMELWGKKVFITVPRWKTGVASTLNYIDLESTTQSPALLPYPSWRTNFLPLMDLSNKFKNNSTIVSTYHVRVDACDRLWVLDTGKADILGQPLDILPTSILIFDLHTDRLLDRIPLPSTIVRPDSVFAKIVVDVDPEKCDDAFAYLPDDETWSLAVFSLATHKFWRIRHNFFHPRPLDGEFSLAGNKFQWDNGIFGLVLSGRHLDGSRSVFFHALSSNHQFITSNKVLQNETLATNHKLSYHKYGSVGDRGERMQAASEVIDATTGTVFYALNNRNSVGCWNSKKPLSPKTVSIIATNNDTLMWPNELQIASNGDLWVLSNRLPLFIFDTLRPDDTNYRILTGKTNLLIGKGSPCDVPKE